MKSCHKIGLWTLVSLVVGNLIGSGVFLLPATLANFGTASLLGWGITSIGAVLLSLVFARMSTFVLKTGGPHSYVEEAFGKTAGFYIAFGYWVLAWVSNAALAVGAIGYLSSVLGTFSLFHTFLLEVLLISGLALINLYSVENVGKFEFWITILKVIPLIIVPVLAICFIKAENFYPINGSDSSLFSAVNASALLTLWAFVGLETATVPGDDVENPRKTIPRAIVIGTLISAFIYILGTTTIIGVLPRDVLIHSKAPYADVASLIWGGSWNIPIAIAAVITCIGTLNGWTMVVGRIAYGAAQDGLFPKIFTKVNKKGAPVAGIIISTCCTIPFAAFSLSETLIKQFNFILEFSVCLVLFIYLVCVLSYFVILNKNKECSFKDYVIGFLALIFSLWALWAASLKIVFISFIIFALGIPVWFYTQYSQKKSHILSD